MKNNIKKTRTLNCVKCNTQYFILVTDYTFNKGKFRKTCSSKCSHSRTITKEHRLKTSNTLMLNNSCNIFYINCKNCNKLVVKRKQNSIFCNNKCLNEFNIKHGILKERLSLGLAKAITTINKRSKNEIFFSELCLNHFNNVELNQPIFNGWNSDIIIHDYKIAILWNGIWHYKKVRKNHSLEQVQTRDKIKIKQIILCGYVPYVIKDMGKYNPKFVKEQFELFINNLTDNISKNTFRTPDWA
jgi:hypothetical protein